MIAIKITYVVQLLRVDLSWTGAEEKSMPIYAYRCRECGEKFEQFRSISSSDDEVACPKCGAKKPDRLICNVFSKSAGESPGYSRPT
jgi:putative FmdB family regulatory protein